MNNLVFVFPKSKIYPCEYDGGSRRCKSEKKWLWWVYSSTEMVPLSVLLRTTLSALWRTGTSWLPRASLLPLSTSPALMLLIS